MSFPKGSDLMVLFDRVDWEPNGEPVVPGGLQVWKEIFNEKTSYKVVHELGKARQRLE